MRVSKNWKKVGAMLMLAAATQANANFVGTDWADVSGLITTTGPYVPQAELSSGAIGSLFGNSVAAWRDDVTGTEWIVVGAMTEGSAAGAAYVFSLSNGATKWQQEAKLVADDAAPNDEFGYAVAIDHDTVVVGAPFHAADLLSGAAYVFVRDEATGTWSKQGDTLMHGEVDFGKSVAIAGDELAAGEPGHERVHLFTRVDGVWSLDDVVSSTDVLPLSAFGSSVALNGQRLIVGAPLDSTIAAFQGSAHIFIGSRGRWDIDGVLRPKSDTNAFELFGTAVALIDDVAVVGAPWQGHGEGAVHVFGYDGTSSPAWSEQQAIEADDATTDAGFGSSVAMSTKTLAVGAPNDSQSYVFGEKSGSWVLISKLSGESDTQFGSSIANDGMAVVVGAPVIDSASGDVDVFINDRIFADDLE